MAEPSDVAKLSAQVKKLHEANSKYKNLLKLAKERIQAQEEELEQQRRVVPAAVLEPAPVVDEETIINRICQRVKVPTTGGMEEIWALAEFEVVSTDDSIHSARRFKEWKRFDTESELQDFIRRDTGEPLQLPPYSMSPEQSANIQKQANEQVTAVAEDFRRFRAKSELARKQAETQIRDLQSRKVESATKRVEVDSERSSIDRLKAELVAQEAEWKQSYETLLKENQALKSAGSEAMLASQWRHRYEQALKEKEDLKTKLQSNPENDNGAYEQKYRDLKESFRLYRKKAKEIFEEQQRGSTSNHNHIFGVADKSSAESKLGYLKNLMINYLMADQTTRDHMEGAIATVLQFTPDEVDRIEKKKAEAEAWFYS